VSYPILGQRFTASLLQHSDIENFIKQNGNQINHADQLVVQLNVSEMKFSLLRVIKLKFFGAENG
jgi:hypothetical protein